MNFLRERISKNKLVRLEKHGILEREQIEKIENFYGLKAKKESLISLLFKILAYFFIALSLLVLIGSNRQEIPKMIRVFLVLTLFVLVQVSAFVNFMRNNHTAAISLFFLANFMYGISIVLISQTFHFGGEFSDFLFWWAFGACLLVFALECAGLSSEILSLEAFAIATIWAFLSIIY